MEYSIAVIKEAAGERITKLMNNQYIVETLPDNGTQYYPELEREYSMALRNCNPESKLFRMDPD